MAEISEKQARRICERLGIAADYPMASECLRPLGGAVFSASVQFDPAWRIVQRAAAEEEDKP